MANVIFDNVTKQYGKIQAINPISFEVKDKEFMVLVGPSGCGKSTLLRMVAGLEDITSGKVSIGDKVVNDLPPKDRDISVVFQNYALYPHMTAYDNMAFGLKIRGLKKAAIKEKVMEAAKILDIEDLLDRKPKAMSGGQRQRIAIGRAIVRQPKVFLFDEPLSNLDAQLRGQMRLEIASLHKRLGATMIYVTHDQVEAMTLGSRIIVLDKGTIQQIDTPQNLYNFPANQFVAGFIGSPKMNLIAGRISIEGGKCFFIDSTNSLNIPYRTESIVANGQEVILGIRPEHIFSNSSQSENGVPVAVMIKWTELLGHDGIAFFEIGGAKISARLNAEDLKNPPFEKKLYFDVSKAHLFSKESGKRLD
jgi:multiple sugar transport system ATP-binding protein